MAGPRGIAIIGMAGRFPGASSVNALWALLREGREGVRTLKRDELETDPSFAAQPNFVSAQGVVDDIELFDADFFGYTPAEAEQADPQQRLLLECAWEALENAGYDPRGLKSIPVGLYAGSGLTLYGIRRLMRTHGPCVATMQSLVGCDKDYLATRVSYKLGLRGPSHAVASACSTSLVSVALACQQLLDYSVDMALAGGVHVTVPQRSGYLHEEGGIFSSDGHCRPFDARGDGTVPSGGAGLVVLKRLEDAVADGDFIWASIRGFAVNNDGDDKVGFTAPSAGGQARVIARALAAAGLKPDDITYVEAHGTATTLGDPIEIQALTQAYATRLRRDQYCAISAIKSNLGHLNTASGVAGLIKVALALHHKEIPATLHFERPNPRIDFSKTPFFVNTTLRPWTQTPRYAGVSSFGFGGTNVHMVLEEAPVRTPSRAAAAPHVLVLSARTETALATSSVRLREHLSLHPDVDLGSVASTLQAGRHLFRYRRAVVCQRVDEAIARLDPDDPTSPSMRSSARPPSIVLLFPGQGSQRPAMGRQLYEGEPAFREVVDACARRLTPLIGHDVHELVLSPDVPQQRLDETALAQPALFVFQVAMAQLLRTMGLEPAAAIGHSVGELAAAYVAGVFDLDGALALVAARSRLMQTVPGGAMLSVFAGEAEIATLLPRGAEVAVIHRPNLCVVAGPTDAIAELDERLTGEGIRATRLHTSHAFHTSMMEPIREALAAAAAQIPSRPPKFPMLSCATGNWHALDSPIPGDAWATQLRMPVQLHRGFLRLFSDFPNCLAIETGPGRTLTDLGSSHPSRPPSGHFVSAYGGSEDSGGGSGALRRAVGRAFTTGAGVNFAAVRGTAAVRRVPLPTYPMERRPYWNEEPFTESTQPVPSTAGVNSFIEVLD